MQLAVASTDLERARIALDAHWLSGLDDDQVQAVQEMQQNASSGQPTCPACGSPFSPQVGRCPDCGLNLV